jgi:hypothetical protein
LAGELAADGILLDDLFENLDSASVARMSVSDMRGYLSEAMSAFPPMNGTLLPNIAEPVIVRAFARPVGSSGPHLLARQAPGARRRVAWQAALCPTVPQRLDVVTKNGMANDYTKT